MNTNTRLNPHFNFPVFIILGFNLILGLIVCTLSLSSFSDGKKSTSSFSLNHIFTHYSQQHDSPSLASDDSTPPVLECNRHLHCSSQQSDIKPHCNMRAFEYQNGKWMKLIEAPNDSEVSPYEQAQWLDTHAYEYQDKCNAGPWPCHIAEPNQCRSKAMRIVSYQWIPDTCHLKDFDPILVDAALAGKSVLFIGDSLMRQMFNSWRFLLQPVWSDPAEALSELKEGFHLKSGGYFTFQWSKYLVAEDLLVNNSTLDLPADSGWQKYLAVNNVDYVVFNVGHHWHKNDVYFKTYDRMVRMVLEKMKQLFKGKAIIFRTSTPGHYNCDSDPNLNLAPIDYIPDLPAKQDKFNWRKPIKAELKWAETAKELGIEGVFHYLNVSSSGYRSDAHAEWNIRNKRNVDCLHWCLPGVPDHWNHLLENLLLELL